MPLLLQPPLLLVLLAAAWQMCQVWVLQQRHQHLGGC
jgi:hypothetical protein